MGVLAEYFKELGAIKSAMRTEITRYALNCLFEGTKKMIEEARYSE